jgi:lysophospholipase L1-like esterase
MRALNLDLQHAVTESGAVFLDAPLKVDWQESDFLDQGHFSKQGAEKFAAAIAPDLQRYCQ